MKQKGWMVCSATGEPCGELLATREVAENEARTYAGGCNGYHARPVEVEITVRGVPPQPWLSKAQSPSTAKGETTL